MTRYNRRGAFSALLLSILVLSSCGKKSASDYVNEAQKLRSSGNMSAAIIDLKNALQLEPNNSAARLLLAKYYLELPDPTSAQGELLRARQDGASPTAVALSLAQADLLLGNPDQALKESQVTDRDTDALDMKADLVAVRAEALLALGNLTAARQAIDEALKDNPHSVGALTVMVRYALTSRDFDGAQKYLAAAQEQEPKNAVLFGLQGAAYFAQGKVQDSEQAYEHMREVAPWNLLARIDLALTQVAQNKNKEADANIAVVLKASPNNPMANYLAGLISYRGGRYAEAQTHIQHTLSAAPNFAPALLVAGAASYALKQYEQANSYLTKYDYLAPNSVPAHKLLAATQVALNHADQAVKTLLPVAAQSSDDPQLLGMIGDAFARTGDLASANRYLSKAIEQQPENASLRAELGATRVALGDTNSGIQELGRAIEQNPSAVPAQTALFVTYLRGKQFDKAMEVAERLQKELPTNPVGYAYAGLTYIAQDNKEAGRNALLKARDLKPGDPLALRALASLAFQEKQVNHAEEYTNEIIKANPKDVQAYLDLAQIQFTSGRAEQGEATLRGAIAATDNAPTALVALAKLLLLQGKTQEALSVVEPALLKDSKNPLLLEQEGRIQLVLRNFTAATSAFTTLVNVLPQSGPAHLALAQAYLASGDISHALSEAQTATSLNPKDEATNTFHIQLMMVNKDYSGARRAVDQMLADNPKSVVAAQLSGDISMAENHPEQAISTFESAMAMNDNGGIRTRLAQAQARAGKIGEAEETLSNWLASHPDDLPVRLALGDIYILDKRFTDAQVAYKEVVAKAPNNAVAENNLAWVLWHDGQAAEALPHARHAESLAPSSPDVLDTLGLVLLEGNQAPEAVTALRKASELAPTALQVKFHLAQALLATGMKEDAKSILTALIATGQPFDGLDAAKKMLASF